MKTNSQDGKKFDVVGLGMNAIDHILTVPRFPQPDTKSRLNRYEMQGGGQIGNALTAASRLGLKCKCLGKVGGDWQGDKSLRMMIEESIDVSDVIIEKEATNQFAFIIVDESTGERTIMAHRHPALELMPGDFSKEALTSGRILFLDGSGSDCAFENSQRAKEAGMTVVIDVERMKPRIPEMLSLSDYIIASETFAKTVYKGKKIEDVLHAVNAEYSPEFCCITLGDRGALGLYKDELIRVPAYKVDVVDTTGAGDVYHAAFIYGLLEKMPIRKIMEFASAAAALKCRKIGARQGAPGLEEVIEFMKDQAVAI